MLPRSHRLPAQEVSIVLRKGKRIKLADIDLVVMNNSLDISRFGFVVSNAIDKRATKRNRIKRLMRASIQPLLSKLPRGKDMVFIARNKDEKYYSQIDSLLSAIPIT